MKWKVLRAGPLTTVQDRGRFGFQESGMTPSGVMDERAYEDACYLTGNDGTEAVLELTVLGAELQFDADTVFAVTGADMSPVLSGRLVPMNRAVLAAEGEVLSLGAAGSGCRAYLSFAGGIDVPLVMGSRSTNLKCGIGGFLGRALKPGDELTVFDPKESAAQRYESCRQREVAKREFPHTLVIRTVPGPQEDAFTEEGIRTFYEEIYRVTAESDRMGYRLDGPKVESRNGVDIISDGTVMGSVQIPESGLPILLMADRQTTGGYAKIGTVLSEDLPKLAQALPGTEIRFVRTPPEIG